MEILVVRTSDILTECGRERTKFARPETAKESSLLEQRSRELIRRFLAQEAAKLGNDVVGADDPTAKDLYKHLEGLAAAEQRLRKQEERAVLKRSGRKDPNDLLDTIERRVAKGLDDEIKARGLDPERVREAISDLANDNLYQEYCELLEGERWRSESALSAVATLLFKTIDAASRKVADLEAMRELNLKAKRKQDARSLEKPIKEAQAELRYYSSVQRYLGIARPE